MQDAFTLRRDQIKHDEKIYRVVAARQKTGTHVSIPIPQNVAEEILSVQSPNPKYLFWDGVGNALHVMRWWRDRYIVQAFAAAKIQNDGHMMSHRLRDTFAVDLLEKGVPMEEVSRLLGHTSIRTTEKSYAKWSKGRQDRADALVTATWKAPGRKHPRKRAARVAA